MAVTDVEPNRCHFECPECLLKYSAVPSVAHADWDACPRCEDDEFQFNMERGKTVDVLPLIDLESTLSASITKGDGQWYSVPELYAIEQVATQALREPHRFPLAKALKLVISMAHSHRNLIDYDDDACDGSGRIPKRSDAR